MGFRDGPPRRPPAAAAPLIITIVKINITVPAFIITITVIVSCFFIVRMYDPDIAREKQGKLLELWTNMTVTTSTANTITTAGYKCNDINGSCSSRSSGGRA